MIKRLPRVIFLGLVIGGLFYAVIAAPKGNTQPKVEKTSTISAGQATSSAKVAEPKQTPVEPKPQPKPVPKPTTQTDGLPCDKGTAQSYVQTKSGEIGLQWQYAYAVVRQESGWDCTPGTDGAGSKGLWQINLPAHPNISYACATDLVCSTNWAAPHLKYMIDTYGLRNGLAAYNAGAAGMKTGKGFKYADEVIHRINTNDF